MRKFGVYSVLRVLFDGGYIRVRSFADTENFQYAELISADCELMGVVPVSVVSSLFKSNVLRDSYITHSRKYDYHYYKVGVA